MNPEFSDPSTLIVTSARDRKPICIPRMGKVVRDLGQVAEIRNAPSGPGLDPLVFPDSLVPPLYLICGRAVSIQPAHKHPRTLAAALTWQRRTTVVTNAVRRG